MKALETDKLSERNAENARYSEGFRPLDLFGNGQPLSVFKPESPAPQELTKQSATADQPEPVSAGRSADGFSVTCEVCERPYTVARLRPDRPRHVCQSCRGLGGVAKAHALQSTPDSSKAERVRAQGLINKRQRLGWFTPPAACMKCGRKKKLDKHHPDYQKPDEVLFLCRSCHMGAHHHPESIAGIAPMKLADRADGNPVGHGRTHSKGGRRGPTGKAKGKSPSITILKVQSAGLGKSMIENLACGHVHIRIDDGKRPQQRRCQNCRPPKVAATLVSDRAAKEVNENTALAAVPDPHADSPGVPGPSRTGTAPTPSTRATPAVQAPRLVERIPLTGRGAAMPLVGIEEAPCR